MKKAWYKNRFRRNLVDMHINDWSEEFLSQFDPDAYLAYLKSAEVNSAMIYLQSHAGLCYFPTESGVMHASFRGRESIMRDLIDRCRAEGVSVVGYYSLIFNTAEHDRHPDWGLIKVHEGKQTQRQEGRVWWGRYGHCCPNNPHYREFLLRQIDEIAAYFTLDGMFYDMTYWSGICHCNFCRERWQKETGREEFPDMTDLKNDGALLFMRKRTEWLADFCGFVTEATRRAMPGITVSHNNAYSVSSNWSVGVTEQVTDFCDYLAGDLYGDTYDHSFCMKYYYAATKNQPFEYMTSRFSNGLTRHTMTKTATKLIQDTLLIAAHHGASLIIDSIDPVGTLDMRVANSIGEAYRTLIPYEPYLSVGKLIENVGIWYSTSGRYNSEKQNYDSISMSKVLAKTLTQAHIPYGIVPNTKSDTLSRYSFLFAPAIAGISQKNREDLYRYVENGGVLYFSGTEEAALLDTFFGARCTGYTYHEHTYAAPVAGYEKLLFDFNEKYPITLEHRHPLIEDVKKDTDILARLALPYSDPYDNNRFASIHSNPPGRISNYPSLMRTRFGKGQVIWSALPIEGYSGYQYRGIVLNLLFSLAKIQQFGFGADAPKRVELVGFADEKRILISAVDMEKEADDGIRILPFPVWVRSEREPKCVRLLPNGGDLSYSYKDGYVHFETRELNIFDMYEIVC